MGYIELRVGFPQLMKFLLRIGLFKCGKEIMVT